MSPVSNVKLIGALKVTAVVLVVSLGIWGCARKPSSQVGGERVRALEGRCVKLEQDYRTVAQARDKARKELATLEERESAERETLIKERDELRRQAADAAKQLAERTAERDQVTRELNVKTAERDTVLNRYEKLRKAVQLIVAQDDGVPQGPNTPTATGAVPSGNS